MSMWARFMVLWLLIFFVGLANGLVNLIWIEPAWLRFSSAASVGWAAAAILLAFRDSRAAK